MATEDERKLFVAGLPEAVDENRLRSLFEATGATVEELSLPRDRGTGKPRGFAFVTLATADEARAARDTLNGTLQGGGEITVRPFQSESRRGPAVGGAPQRGRPDRDQRTLFVGNLPWSATREELASLLEQRGVTEVERLHMPLDEEGRARGFGFVTLRDDADVDVVMGSLQNVELGGRRLTVNVARPRAERGAPGSEPRGPSDWPDRGGPRGFGGPPSGTGAPPERPREWAGEPAPAPPPWGGGGPDEGGGGGGDGARRKDKKKRAKERGGGAGAAGAGRRGGRGWQDWDDD